MTREVATESGNGGAMGRQNQAPGESLKAVVNSIGPKVRHLRKQWNLSLQQLADRSNVSTAAIHKVEQGTMVPTITTLLKLAAALEQPVSYFVEEDQEPPFYVVFTPATERRSIYTPHQGLTLGGISGPYGQYFVATAIAEVESGAGQRGAPSAPRRRGTDPRAVGAARRRCRGPVVPAAPRRFDPLPSRPGAPLAQPLPAHGARCVDRPETDLSDPS